jgi:hypothetical protein
MRASELLRKGAEEIERRGWTRDWFGDDPDKPDTCRVCAIGGLRAAMTGDPFTSKVGDPLFGEAREFLLRAIGNGRSVVNWNDANGRTQADVLGLFSQAAALAEREEANR